MQPSDFRYDPFSDVSTAVVTTERHLIPSTSPYVVMLCEIPQKTSPSTMTVTEIDGTGTAGTSFAEVAAIPESGQFWADYNTGAAGSENWNTGKLLFNAADAGKLVEVSYTATGTLAGVKSNRYPSWWLDRGDGSDGDFCPATDTTISGLKQYRSVFIPAGVTVSVDKYVRICCQGAFINLGNINASGAGGAGGAGGIGNIVGSEGTNATNGFVGAVAPYGRGGAGGAGMSTASAYGAGGMTNYGLYDTSNTILESEIIVYGAGGSGGGAYAEYIDGSSAGGSGGNGGGGIRLTCASFKNTGSIISNGSNGNAGGSKAGGGGGGNGGVVIIVTFINLATGTITVNGGAGNTRGAAGGAGYYVIKELGVM